jgi:hypothetical protein
MEALLVRAVEALEFIAEILADVFGYEADEPTVDEKAPEEAPAA